jgi:hypothetical protein
MALDLERTCPFFCGWTTNQRYHPSGAVNKHCYTEAAKPPGERHENHPGADDPFFQSVMQRRPTWTRCKSETERAERRRDSQMRARNGARRRRKERREAMLQKAWTDLE